MEENDIKPASISNNPVCLSPDILNDTVYSFLPSKASVHCSSNLCSMTPLKTWKLATLCNLSQSLRSLDLALSLCLIVVSSHLNVCGAADSANCQSQETHRKQQKSQPAINPSKHAALQICCRIFYSFSLENLVNWNSSWSEQGKTFQNTTFKTVTLTSNGIHLTLN